MAANPSSPHASDASFWHRQNSMSPFFDHLTMPSSPTRPVHPNVELFVASPAGKPLYYFAYNRTHPLHPFYSSNANADASDSCAPLSSSLSSNTDPTAAAATTAAAAATRTTATTATATANSSSHTPEPAPKPGKEPAPEPALEPPPPPSLPLPTTPQPSSSQPQPRPAASIASLSATLTAFQEATLNRISVIKTAHGTIVTHVHNVLHVILVCKQTPVPNTLLNALVQTVILGTYFFSSLALDSYLQTNPNARPSFLARISPLLDVVLLDVVSHPLSYALAKPTVLPSTCTPFNRRRLSEVMSNLITDPSFRDVVTYAVMFTSGPPFPCQLVVSCGPIHAALTSHDLLILSCLSTHDSQQNRLSQTRTSAQTQHKVYPQAWNFERGFHLVSRHVELRLHPDHYDRFKSAVGGHSWRPEWTHRPPHSVTVSLLTSNVDSAYCFLDQLECRLDRASDVTSLLICMERPLNMHPLSVHGVRDIIVLNARDRVAGTLGAFAYPAAICALMTMQRADSGEMDGKTCDSNLFVRTFAKIGLRVVYWRRRIVVLFDLRDSTSDAAAVHVTRNILEPQINRYMRHIIPPDERVVIHARTPLAGFLAPFVS